MTDCFMLSSGLTRRSIAGDCRVKRDNDKRNTSPIMTGCFVILMQLRRKSLYNLSSKNLFENFSASLGYAKFFSAAVSLAILAKSL